MTHLDVIRAWNDEEYRLSLSEAEQALLPAHPAGLIELSDAQLGAAAGGQDPVTDFIGEYILGKIADAVVEFLGEKLTSGCSSSYDRTCQANPFGSGK